MTVLEVIRRSADFLARNGVDSPRLQIELLLAHVLQTPRLKLYLNFERVLSDAELDTLRALVRRRAAREPLQHLVGSTSFCGLEIAVGPDVLIPRPETEQLAELALKHLPASAPAASTQPTVLDFGTGSGCLAITIAVHRPQVIVHACDASAAALSLARQNAARHGVADRVHFHCGDGLAALPAGVRFDLLVSNPPYVPTHEILALQPEVRDHDPRLALDGGPDGLDFHRRLANGAPAFLHPRAPILLEFGDGQERSLPALFAPPAWVVETVARDLSGRPRFLIAHRGE